MFTDNCIHHRTTDYVRRSIMKNTNVMKNIQVLLNEDEYTVIETKAKEAGQPIPVYVRSRLLGDENELSAAYAEALRRVEALALGTPFDLKTLFGTDWTMSRGTKLTLGRTFYEMVRSDTISMVKVLGKDSSNIMQYERV